MFQQWHLSRAKAIEPKHFPAQKGAINDAETMPHSANGAEMAGGAAASHRLVNAGNVPVI